MRNQSDLYKTSQIGQLQQLLDSAERGFTSVGSVQGSVVDVILASDQIFALIGELEPRTIDVRAERARAETLIRKLTGGAPGIVRLVQSSGRQRELLRSPTYDAILQARISQSRGRVRRMWVIGVPMLAVVIMVGFVLPRFSAPSVNSNELRSLAADGKLDAALVSARAQSARAPNDLEGALWVGALEQARGNTAAADAAWVRAQQIEPDGLTFHFQRGTILLELGKGDMAEADARTLIADTASAAAGYVLLGGVEEQRGHVPEASAAFEQAAKLASEQNKPQIEVIAKTRLGMLRRAGP